jgi:uncharacterized phage protein gp47/JayE
MATEIFGPLLPLQLDSRNVNDIVRAIQSRIYIESGGQLTDFTPASPLAAISEGQGFAQAELLYYLNSLPEAVTVQWLRNLGIQRRIGSRALVEVTFYRVPGYSRPVTIPSGTKVYASGGQVYITLDQVRMTESSATVTAQSERWGTVYNVPAGSIGRVERNFLGLDSVINNSAAEGGTDLETVEDMKIRAFELFGRRNLTSRSDFESEVSAVAPEATLVRVMSYEERFGENSRGVFIVAGGDDGSPLSIPTQQLLLTSIRDRVPLDVKVYLATPSIVPVEVVINILWDPRVTTTFTDTLAENLKTIAQDVVYPSAVGLGNDLSNSTLLREILALDYVVDVPVLDIKQMILDPEVTGATDGLCGRFVGVPDETTNTCSYSYDGIVAKTSTEPLKSPDSTTGFRLYRAIVSLTSVVDYSTLTYTYERMYDIV